MEQESTTLAEMDYLKPMPDEDEDSSHSHHSSMIIHLEAERTAQEQMAQEEIDRVNVLTKVRLFCIAIQLPTIRMHKK